MNPQGLIYMRLSESTVGALPAERKSEFQFGIGESDMIGLIAGIVGTVAVQWLWRKLAKRPTPWAARRTIRIADLPEYGEWLSGPQYSVSDLRDDTSGDCLIPADAVRVS